MHFSRPSGCRSSMWRPLKRGNGSRRTSGYPTVSFLRKTFERTTRIPPRISGNATISPPLGRGRLAQPGIAAQEPHEEVDEQHRLQQEPEERPDPRQKAEPDAVPAAEEQGHGHGGDRDHVNVLAEKEHPEADPGVLGVESGHELGL